MIFAVLATGPSMNEAVAEAVRGKAKVIAVSDAFRMAPWAEAMVSTDAAWWRASPDAIGFKGRKFSIASVDGVEKIDCEGAIANGSNSGMLGCHVAVKLGATRILLCGFDMRGSHYFGPHKAPLKNTRPRRFDVFQDQFARFKPRGVQILNCTPGSALRAYPMADLHESLAEPALHGA